MFRLSIDFVSGVFLNITMAIKINTDETIVDVQEGL